MKLIKFVTSRGEQLYVNPLAIDLVHAKQDDVHLTINAVQYKLAQTYTLLGVLRKLEGSES